MMLLAVLGYFVLACALVALLFLPDFRFRVGRRLQGVWGRLDRLSVLTRAGLGSFALECQRLVKSSAADGWRGLRQHRMAVAIMLALLLIPPLIVFSVRGWRTLEGFSDIVVPSDDAMVATLLQGEQLVPPLPLPPEVFMTPEVESVRPQLVGADRRWELLDKDFKQLLLLVYKLMREEHGYEMVLIEGYRSPERQNMLARLGPHVTNAAAWQSLHQYGRAADSAFMRANKLVISERDPWAMKGYEFYGQVAQRVGLSWGGKWQNVDLGHVELRKP